MRRASKCILPAEVLLHFLFTLQLHASIKDSRLSKPRSITLSHKVLPARHPVCQYHMIFLGLLSNENPLQILGDAVFTASLCSCPVGDVAGYHRSREHYCASLTASCMACPHLGDWISLIHKTLPVHILTPKSPFTFTRTPCLSAESFTRIARRCP